jgi:hypothetical protein
VWKSVKEYVPAILKLWWVVVVGGILSAVGVVLNIVQGLTIPAWLLVVIGLMGLFVAQFLAFHRVKLDRDHLQARLDDKARKTAICEAIGEFLNEGLQLRMQCADEKKEPPNEKADDWAARVEKYLSSYLGNSYVFRFRSDAGLPMVATSISSIPHRNLWGGIHTRLSRLEQFIGEITN